MGQQQSAEKSSGSRSGTPQAEKDRKVNRRVSIQALSHSSRATPVDPSASKDNAVAQTTSQHLEKPQLQQYLQSSSPESSARDSKVSRSSSKATRQKHDLEHRTRLQPVSEPQPSDPMNVPMSRSKQDEFDSTHFQESHAAYDDRRYTPMSKTRPPRLPLPIADVAVPDSPTLMPVDKGNSDVPIFETDEPIIGNLSDSHVRRRSSMVSTTTQDEEEVGEELQPYAVDGTGQMVPTVIEWNRGGTKVYVTGTFANWDRKFRLHHRKNGPGMYTTITLPPGTHHILFVIDGTMTISEDLPTAVDFNNILVNYIEVAYDVDPKTRRESTNVGSTGIPYAGQSPTPEEDESQDDLGEVTPDVAEVEEPFLEEIPAGDFRQVIPQALVDIDLPEDDPRYQQAARIISDGVGPPTLPLFLSRTILNGLLPVKDDSSVLTLPNHTVLNHLMTSSVKNGVLSTSVTTRYKKKYVTTISFKPVPKFNQTEQ